MIIYQRIIKLWSWHELASETIRGNTQKVWKRDVSFLYAIYCHDLFYITVKYHDNIPMGIQVMELKRKRIWNNQGEITQKVWKRKLSFLIATHCHGLFYITSLQRVFKLQSGHEYAQKSIKGEITQKVIKRELSFLYETHRHDLFYITMKYHQNIPNYI